MLHYAVKLLRDIRKASVLTQMFSRSEIIFLKFYEPHEKCWQVSYHQGPILPLAHDTDDKLMNSS